MGDIKLADSLKHKDLTFRLFKDRELGISKGFQKILHNSVNICNYCRKEITHYD